MLLFLKCILHSKAFTSINAFTFKGIYKNKKWSQCRVIYRVKGNGSPCIQRLYQPHLGEAGQWWLCIAEIFNNIGFVDRCISLMSKLLFYACFTSAYCQLSKYHCKISRECRYNLRSLTFSCNNCTLSQKSSTAPIVLGNMPMLLE